MLQTLELYSAICQLYFNKLEKYVIQKHVIRELDKNFMENRWELIPARWFG